MDNYWIRKQRQALSRRRLLQSSAAAGIGLGGLALVGCGGDDDNGSNGGGGGTTPGPGGGSAGEPRQGGVVRLAQPRELPHYDPHTETYPAGLMVALVHAGLLRFKASPDDPNALMPEPYLAESTEQPEQTLMTVKLRPNAKFQDLAPVNGRAVTAEDVKFSFERIMTDEPEFQRRTFFAAVTGIDAVDEQTVQFKLDKPFAPLPVYMADTWNVVIPKEIVEEKGDMRDTAIGAGPFTLTSYDKGVGLKLAKSANFWGDKGPYLDEVQLPMIVDPAATLAAFRSKQTELMRDIPWAEVGGFQRADDVEVREYSNVDLQYIRINTQRKPLDDARVRRALSLALDRNVVANGAFQGNGIPQGVFPAAVNFAVKPEDLPHYQYNLQEAKALLKAAGLEDGFEVENIYPSGSGKQQDMAAVVADQLRAINVTVKNRTLEYGAYLQAAFSKEFDINIHWGNRYDDPDGYAIEYLQDGGRNFGFWGSDELDELILGQREVLDQNERAEKLKEIQTKIAEEMYTVGIANWKTYDAWYTRLQNMATSVHWFRPAQQLAEAWLQA